MNNVKDFGTKGDGLTKDTAAVQRAIDAEGMVFFPPGVYLCGTLYLRSNGGLHLEPGAVLLASPDRTDYNLDDFCPQNQPFSKEHVSGAHFIVAVEQHNITLSGSGKIDGNRQAFYGDPEQPKPVKIRTKFELGTWRPAQMIYLCECTGVTIRDIQLFNAPYWTCFLHGCEDITITGIRILNDQRTRNGDGIDLDSCQRATVSGCIIDSGDDCITLRGNPGRLKKNRACEHIAISNCVLHTNCNAFRIGVGDGTVRNCTISNITFHHTRTAICIVSNYLRKGSVGVHIENIVLSNLVMEAEQPFVIVKDLSGIQSGPGGNPIRNISFSHIRGCVSESSIICGNAEGCISGIAFDDITLDYIGNSRKPRITTPTTDYSEWNGTCPQSACYVTHAEDISFNRIRFNWLLPDPAWRYGLQCVETKSVHYSNCQLGMPILIDGKEANENVVDRIPQI